MKIITLIVLIFPFLTWPYTPEEINLIKEKTAIMRGKTLKEPYKKARPANIFEKNTNLLSKTIESICFIGDTGSGDKNEKIVADLIKFHSFGQKKDKCSIIYHLGDIIYPVGIQNPKTDNEFNERFYNFYSKIIGTPNSPPFFFVLGNHDYYGDIDKWFEISRRYPKINFPYYYYLRNFSNVCILAIDSNVIFEQGYNGMDSPRFRQQEQWLKNIVQPKLGNCEFKILVAHHLPFSGTGRDVAGPILDFYKSFIEGSFQIVMGAHDHLLAHVKEVNGTQYFISGAGGKVLEKEKRARVSQDFKKLHPGPGFMKLVIKRNPRSRKIISASVILITEKEGEQNLTTWSPNKKF